MNVCPLFVANPQSAILMKPGQRAFNDPAALSQTTAVPAASLTDKGSNQAPAQFATMEPGVVARIPQK